MSVYCISVQGKGTELTQSSVRVQNVDDIVKDIHRELLIYTVNLRILESIGQGIIFTCLCMHGHHIGKVFKKCVCICVCVCVCFHRR